MAKANITEAWLKRAPLPDGVDRVRYWDERLAGFGVVVGRRAITFIVRHRVAGKRRDVTIGHWQRPGAGGDHGSTWTERRARERAIQLLGAMSQGVDPVAEQEAKRAAPTLADAFDAHVARLRSKRRSEATISTFEKSRRYLGELLELPIKEVTGEVLRELHERIRRQAAPRANTRNDRGAPLANRVIVNVGTAWATLNRNLQGKLGNWNPARSVDKVALEPKRVRIDNLADWHRRVLTMRNPIQRDGLLLALFTGLRHEDVRSVRFEHVDLEVRTLRLPDPKGGEARAFTIPLPVTCVDIIRRRREQNVHQLAGASDRGWVFPAIDSDGEVGPIGDLRQQVHTESGKHSRFPAEDVHTLRRTYASVAQEAGISEIDQRVLTNHSFASGDVHEIYIAQHIDHLRACQDRIEAALWARIRPATPQLRAV